MRTLNRHRLWQAVVDSGLVALAWYLAFNIRFDRGVPPRYDEFLAAEVILIVVGVKILTFIVFGLYDHWWRYVSIRDMWRSLLAVTVASVVAVVAIYLWNPVPGWRLPRGIIASVSSRKCQTPRDRSIESARSTTGYSPITPAFSRNERKSIRA